MDSRAILSAVGESRITQEQQQEAAMAEDESEDSPSIKAYKAILTAVETSDVFSYRMDFDALANLIGVYYEASLGPIDVPSEQKRAFKKACTNACVSYIQQRLSSKLTRAGHELIAEAFSIALTFVMRSVNAPSAIVEKSKVSAKSFEVFLAASREGYIAPLRGQYLRERNSPKPDYDLTALSSHYDSLLPMWRLAKQDAIRDQKHAQHRHNWRARLETYQFPEDLLEWLNQSEAEKSDIMSKHADFPYLQEKLASGYVLTKPSEIALEHSARLCGAEPYFYSIAYLFEVLKKQR